MLTRLLAVTGGGARFSTTHLPAGTIGTDDLLPGGAKIRGLNITLSAAQISAASAGNLWASMWANWDETWMTDQLDDAVAYGCNAVRTMGSIAGIYGGEYTEADYLDLWSHFIELCADRGLYVYPCMQPGNPSDSDFGSVPYANVEAYALNWLRRVGRTRRCIGVDVVQESDAYATSTDGQSLIAAMQSASDLPMTYSVAGGTKSQLGHADNNAVVLALFDIVDYFDFHWYADPTSTDIETWWWDNGAGRPTKRVLIGEFGGQLSLGSSAQTTRYQAIVDTISYEGDSGRRPAGGFAWCARDFNTVSSDQWGLKSADGTERTYISSVFETLPVT